jgi:CRP/FNR family transcriptional regulator, cyclic AMP receptor protein
LGTVGAVTDIPKVPLAFRSGALGRAGMSILAAVPLFSEMSKRQLRSLADQAKIVRYSAGRTILAEGGSGVGSMFVLLDGTARIVRRGRTIARIGPGDFFGELSILDGRPRSASVVTVSDVVTARLSRPSFLHLVRSDPNIALRMMGVLATRLRDKEGGREL